MPATQTKLFKVFDLILSGLYGKFGYISNKSEKDHNKVESLNDIWNGKEIDKRDWQKRKNDKKYREYQKNYRREYDKNKRKNDPSYKLKQNLSRRVRSALTKFKTRKNISTLELTGIKSIQFLMNLLVFQHPQVCNLF